MISSAEMVFTAVAAIVKLKAHNDEGWVNMHSNL